MNSKDSTLDTYVIGNSQRPVLSYGTKGNKTERRSYLYVEALNKFEEEVKELDLSEAYRRARPAFRGKLEQTFIILKDSQGEEEQVTTGSNTEPVKEK